MPLCLICRSPIASFMSFGKMPIANGFLTAEQLASEFFFELKVGFCTSCHMVQLTELVEPTKMFHENYAFFASTSSRMVTHFAAFAQFVKDRYLGADPFVVEIGSNDGIMLQHFRAMRHLGIEPSENVARVAIDKGIRTICRFFGEPLAREIVAEHGQADAFLGANVMCHIPDLHSVAAGVKLLLKPKGVLVFEDPYLGDIVDKTSYDQIYDEHVFYFSLSSLRNLFARHELEIIDAIPQDVHGGSMRYVVAHTGAHRVAESVAARLAAEQEKGLGRIETFERLHKNIEASRDALLALLHELRRKNQRIVGYGATSKSTTVLNYCGITPELIEYISDTTPIKQGKLSPGMHIPVRPYDTFKSAYPDYALLFAWNHAKEIMAKETNFPGKWITYVPRVGVL